MPHTPPRIAVCFFGITRSLSYTVGSIRRRILAPARRVGTVRVFCHFFEQSRIANPRSGEFGTLRADEHALLAPDRLETEPPGACLGTWDFDALKARGDFWRDDNVSLRNLVHQLHSLDRVTALARAWGPDLVVFARPDLRYHGSLMGALRALAGETAPVVALPAWQGFERGFNDRFAVATAAAAPAYGGRAARMLDYCDARGGPLHAEFLLRYALEEAGVAVRDLPVLASRVRFDGTLKKESFCPEGTPRWRRYLTRLRAMA